MTLAVRIDQLCTAMGWGADSVEARLLRAADGARPGYQRNGLVNVGEVSAYLRSPGNAAFLTYDRIADIRRTFATLPAQPTPATESIPAPTEGVTIRTMRQAWQRATAQRFDTNRDGVLTSSEFDASLAAFMATQRDHSVTGVDATAQGPIVMSDQRVAIILAAIADRTDDPNLLESCRGSTTGYEISRDYFRACYDESLRVPLSVSYLLSSGDVHGRADLPRVDAFQADPFLLSAGRPIARPVTYGGTGYDQGHQMPFEDHSDSRSRSVTFLMTNMVPQAGPMNQQVWRRLEAAVHELVETRGGRVVVQTGPMWLDEAGRPLPREQIQRIGVDRPAPRPAYSIAVPTHCFKAVLYYPADGSDPVMFAYRVPNSPNLPTRDEGVGELLRASEVTVDELEAQTGLDFFDGLSNRLERPLERRLGGFARAARSGSSDAPPTTFMSLLLPRVVVPAPGPTVVTPAPIAGDTTLTSGSR